MISNNTLGYLKRRILDVLDEYYTSENTVFVTDGKRELIEKRMPDTINACLVRMYESVSVAGDGEGIFKIFDMSASGIQTKQKDNKLCFYSGAVDIVLSFMYFGEGKVTLCDEKDAVICEHDLDKSEKFTLVAKKFSIENEGMYYLTFSKGLCVKLASVYEYDTSFDVSAYAPSGYRAMRLASDFSRFEGVTVCERRIDTQTIHVKDGFGFIRSDECHGCDTAHILYKKASPVICENTPDDFIFDMPSVAFEALICLVASELCREDDAGMYTRLLYKYNDLYEGLCGMAFKGRSRNTFYKNTSGKRW